MLNILGARILDDQEDEHTFLLIINIYQTRLYARCLRL
jgi:hypothetical protein